MADLPLNDIASSNQTSGDDSDPTHKSGRYKLTFILNACAMVFRMIVLSLISFVACPSFAEVGRPDQRRQFEIGISAFSEKNYEKSREVFLRLSAEDASNSIYWFNLGNCEYQLHAYGEAIAAYRKTVELKSR